MLVVLKSRLNEMTVRPARTLVWLAAAVLGLVSLAMIVGGTRSRADEQFTRSRPGLSWNQAIAALTSRMDPSALELAQRFDPALATPLDPNAVLTGAPGLDSPADMTTAKAFANLSPNEALLLNQAIPFVVDANAPARPFFLGSASLQDRARAVHCLTQAVYYEAGFEPLAGRQAVAQVVLNRVRHPAYPKSVCGVVFEGSGQPTGCQFTFACDGALGRPPSEWAWREAEKVAIQALDGFVMAAVGNSTHYHTQWVLPYWAPNLLKVKQIGAHIFYRWPGGWGLPSAFRLAYAGREEAFGDQLTAKNAATLAAEDSPPPVEPTMIVASLGKVVSGPAAAGDDKEALVVAPSKPVAAPLSAAIPTVTLNPEPRRTPHLAISGGF
jgi:spore germination cell wall hydrolase CwlJ-like protein